MKTDAENKVLKLLEGGRALNPEQRRGVLGRLNDKEQSALLRIASGRMDTDPRSRLKAVSALGQIPESKEKARTTLRDLLKEPNRTLQVKAVQALHKISDPRDLPLLRTVVQNPDSDPSMALAAARVIAETGGPEATEDLADLRKRLLPLVEGDHSPSIRAIDRLILEVRGEIERRGDGQKPIA